MLFAGHTDVVPAGEAAKWRHDPFSGDIAAGEIFGRGASDMKGAIGAFAAAAFAYLEKNGPLKRGSIGFLITGDEEGPAINGTVKMLRWAKERGEVFDHCIVGEPTNPDNLGDMIKIGRRGSLNGQLTVHEVQGHVAYPKRADNPTPHLLALCAALTEQPLDTGTDWFEASNLEITSIDIGNDATNVIPGQAQARFNVRFNDAWTPDALIGEIRKRLESVRPPSDSRCVSILATPSPSSPGPALSPIWSPGRSRRRPAGGRNCRPPAARRTRALHRRLLSGGRVQSRRANNA